MEVLGWKTYPGSKRSLGWRKGTRSSGVSCGLDPCRGAHTKRGGPSGSPMLMTVHSCLEMAEPGWSQHNVGMRDVDYAIRDNHVMTQQVKGWEHHVLRRLWRRVCSALLLRAEGGDEGELE